MDVWHACMMSKHKGDLAFFEDFGDPIRVNASTDANKMMYFKCIIQQLVLQLFFVFCFFLHCIVDVGLWLW